MALIGKIRNNFWFVLLLLGFALAAFILMDMDTASNQGGLGPKQVVGKVAGQEIDYRDFQRTEQALFSGGTDTYAGKASAWNYFTEKAIVDKQADLLGVNVSMEELEDLQFGNNLSPVIQNYFRNQQTGQIDMQQLLNVKQSIQSDEQLNPDFEMRWSELQKQIIKTAKQEKISNLVSKAMYTPTFLAERVGQNTSTKVNFEYVKIPFTKVEDSSVELTDADFDAYIKENAHLYENDEETRVMEYAVINVLPTSNDSAKIYADLEAMKAEFQTNESDSIYAVNNEGFYSTLYASKDQVTGDLQEAVSTMNVGDVYGPYLNTNAYIIAKLTGKAIVPDTVEASHILRIVTPGSTTSLNEAKAYIDSLRTLVESGQSTVAELAAANSQDPSTASKEGAFDPFVQGYLLPALNNAAFYDSKEGGLYTVVSQAGVHLMRINKRTFIDREPKYRLAYIPSPIVPSEDTQNDLFDKADQMVDNNRTLESLRAAVEADPNITIESTAPQAANDYLFGNLGGGETSRDIIRWAFDVDTDKESVAPSVYTYSDPVNYFNSKYVLVGLKSVNPAGLPSGADMRSTLETVVRNKKKGEKLSSQISGTDLASIASSNGVIVESASDVNLSASGVAGLGSEPEVMAAAFSQSEGAVSKPIIGNNGVYVVKTISKTEGTVPGNVIAQKREINNTNRSRAGFSLMNALKEMFKPTDNRSKFF